MKFMMNGALTVGTHDGANIEMAEEAGPENLFLFGLTAEEVAGSAGWYSPYWHYDNEPETRAALDLVFSDHFSRNEPGIFAPLRDTLLSRGDHYMHLADLKAYIAAQEQVGALYADRQAWSHRAIDRLIFFTPRPGLEGRQGDFRRLVVHRVVDRFQSARDGFAVFPGGELHAVAQKMDDAGLDDGLGVGRVDRLGKALQSVDHRQEDVLDAPVLQFVQDSQPELRALVLFDRSLQDGPPRQQLRAP